MIIIIIYLLIIINYIYIHKYVYEFRYLTLKFISFWQLNYIPIKFIKNFILLLGKYLKDFFIPNIAFFCNYYLFIRMINELEIERNE